MKPNVVTDPGLAKLEERYQNLCNEEADAKAAKKDLEAEVRAAGHDVSTFKNTVKRRRETSDQHTKRVLKEEAIELMMAKLGALHDSPLGQAAMARAAE